MRDEETPEGGRPQVAPPVQGEMPPPLPTWSYPPPPPPPPAEMALVKSSEVTPASEDPAALVSAICLLIGSAVAFMTLLAHIGSGFACLSLCLLPLINLSVAIVTFVEGMRSLVSRRRPPGYVPIVMMCNVLSCDVINFALGIAVRVICRDKPGS